MEIKAVIEALRAIPEGSGGPITIRTDSQFVINGITLWIRGWIKKGWLTTQGEPVKNQDLWKELLDLTGQHVVIFEWVRGHNGDEWNERVDALANDATGASPEERAEMNRRIGAQRSWVKKGRGKSCSR